MERRYPYYDLIMRSNDSSRFIEERSDGKLSRYVLESSGKGNLFTDFNHNKTLWRRVIVLHL